MPPAAATARPKDLPKTLADVDVAALMAVPNMGAPTGLRNRCILELMHKCGLRVGETCKLHLRDVRWGEGRIHLRAEITKNNQEAFAYLDEPTAALLERWKDRRREYAARRPHLFTTLKGGPVDRRYVWSMMQRYARRAGLEPPIFPHMLRHTFATDLLRSGEFSIREVQQLLRHADVRTTQIYTHVHEEELHRKLRARAR